MTLQETEAIAQVAHSNADQRADCVANRTAAEEEEKEEEEEGKRRRRSLYASGTSESEGARDEGEGVSSEC